MTEVDPDSLRTAPGDPAGHVGKVGNGDVNERPDRHRKPCLNPATQLRAVGDSHGLRFKLVRSNRRCPINRNADGLPLVLRQPTRVFGF